MTLRVKAKFLACFMGLFQLLHAQEMREDINFSSEDIFQEVFEGSGLTRKVQMEVPFFFGKKQRGETLVFLSEEGRLKKFRAQRVLEALEETLSSEYRSTLKEWPKQFLDKEDLKSLGIEVFYNPRSQKLFFNIPPELKREKVHSVTPAGHRGKDGAKLVEPEAFSSFINSRVSDSFYHKYLPNVIKTRTPLQAEFERAVRVGTLVLEGKTSFDENEIRKWQRKEVAFVQDFPERLLRVRLGDIENDTVGYQSSLELGGIGIAKNFALQPQVITYPQGERSLFLQTDSTVEIWVNKRLRNTLVLEKGRHTLRDFRLDSGVNEVELLIRDSFGRETRVEYKPIIEDELLKDSLSQYAFVVGFPQTTVEGLRKYDSSQPVVTAFYSKGINTSFTLGGYLQAKESHSVLGCKSAYANLYGLFEWDVAMSHKSGYASDLASKLIWTSLEDSTDEKDVRHSFSVEYLGKNFGDLSQENPSGEKAYVMNASISKTLVERLTGSLFYRSEIVRSRDKDPYRLGARLKKTFRGGVEANLECTIERFKTGDVNESAILRLDYRFPNSGHQLNYAYLSPNQSNSMKWSYQPNDRLYGLNTDVILENNENESLATVHGGYQHERAYINATSHWKESSAGQQGRTNVNFATSLTYAGGSLSMARPVQDSFVIIKPDPSLKGRLFAVNPRSYGFEASTRYARSLSLGQITSYHPKTIEVVAPQLPPGKNLTGDRYLIKPTYKSAFLIEVGLEENILVKGQIMGEDGSAIAFQSGTIQFLDDLQAEPLFFFTNQEGVFRLSGFRSGSYELSLFEEGFQTQTFDVPRTDQSIYSLKPLTIKKKGR